MKNWKKLTVLLLTLSLTAGLLAACTSKTEPTPAPQESAPAAQGTTPASQEPSAPAIQTVTAGKLTVAISPDFAPMEFVDASKSGQEMYVGFDVELAKYIAQHMGLELVISPMDFFACQTAVAMDNVDMAISGFSWLAEREENYNLSDFYHAGDNEDGQTTITMASNGDKYADAPNMTGLKVGVQGASLQEALAKEQLPNAEIVVFADLITGAMQLRNGDFDIMCCAQGNADAIISSNPDMAKTGFDFYVDPKYTDNLILMKKGNDALTAQVNEILAQAVSESKYPGWYDDAKALAGIESATEISYDENGNPIQ